MRILENASALFSSIEPDGPIEVALLMRRTGVVLAAWARDGVSQEVFGVMAATMLGSIATMSDAVGRPEPERVFVDMGHSRVLAVSVEAQTVLVLVVPRAEPPEALDRAARRILDRLGGAGRKGPRTGPGVPAGTPPPALRHNR